MVEAAGVEPASLEPFAQISTSIVGVNTRLACHRQTANASFAKDVLILYWAPLLLCSSFCSLSTP